MENAHSPHVCSTWYHFPFLHSEVRRCQTGEEATSALHAAGRSIMPKRCNATAKVSTNAASSAVSLTVNAYFTSQWHQIKRCKHSNRVGEQYCFISARLLDPSELHPFRRYFNQVNQQLKASTYSNARLREVLVSHLTEKGGIISSWGLLHCDVLKRPWKKKQQHELAVSKPKQNTGMETFLCCHVTLSC